MCVTAQELLDFRINGCTVSEILCVPYDEIQDVVDETIERIQAITNTKFCPETKCMKFDGSGTNRLYFKPNTVCPLISFTTVTKLCCNSSEIVTDTIDNRGDWLDLNCGGCFPCGTNNIEVCGEWGAYATLPRAVRRAIIYLALEMLQPGITGFQTDRNAVNSVIWTDLSIAYKLTDIDFAAVSTGVPYIDQMLQPFIPTISQIDFFVIGDKDACVKRNCGIPLKESDKNYGNCNDQDHCS